VKQGESLEKETRSAAASTAAAAREAAAEGAARVQTIAGDTWDKLEKVFEDRVAKALARLGVHTQSDVEQLSQRVDALADAVNELIRAQGGKPKARRKASPVKRIVKSTMKSATRTAKGAATSASNAVGGAARTAGKGVRVARKVAKAALGK
jgi:poly(hydroxyalkanoate) granule-associated protein